MATSITLTTNNASTEYTLATGGRGPAGASGASAFGDLGGVPADNTALAAALALKAPLISPSFTTPELGDASATSIAASGTVTGSNLSGGNTGDETAARIATALNAGTEDSTATETDKLAVTHPAGGWMLLSTLWTWIKAKIDAGMTIAGAQAFSGAVSITDATASTTSTTGALKVAGGLGVGGNIVSAGKVANTAIFTTLGAGATTFAVTNSFVRLTGNAGTNTIATITGGVSGQTLVLMFADALVTITNSDSIISPNTIDLSAAFTSSARDTLTLIHDGNKWIETSRSIN